MLCSWLTPLSSLPHHRMSKLAGDVVEESIKELLAKSEEKKRKFVETVELQVALKNYDPVKV